MNEPVSPEWRDVSAWRKAQRESWIAWRGEVPDNQRIKWDLRITEWLRPLLDKPQGMVVGFCWPYKAEFDARFAVRHWRDQGALAALPEVVGKGKPLRFRRWWPGAPMTRGVYDIPLPDGTPEEVPDVAIVPMNAHDGRGYRLGYGGGFFDRTLAALERRVVAIGVTYAACRVSSIVPQQHDLPMDLVVTEAGVHRAGGEPLATLELTDAVTHVRQLMHERGLPRNQ